MVEIVKELKPEELQKMTDRTKNLFESLEHRLFCIKNHIGSEGLSSKESEKSVGMEMARIGFDCIVKLHESKEYGDALGAILNLQRVMDIYPDYFNGSHKRILEALRTRNEMELNGWTKRF